MGKASMSTILCSIKSNIASGAMNFMLLSVVGFTIILVVFKAQVLLQEYFLLQIVISFTDSLLLLLPAFLFRKYQKAIAIVLILLATIIVYINLLYFRNFTDVVPSSLYSILSFNKFSVQGALSSVAFSDIIFLCIPILIICYAVYNKSNLSSNISRFARKTYLLIMITMVLFSISLSMVRLYIIFRDEQQIDNIVKFYGRRWSLQTGWYILLRDYGFSGYIIRVIYDCFDTGVELSNSDKQCIASFLLRSTPDMSDDYILSFADNKNKNLVFITVESLNASIFDHDSIAVLAPTMSSFIRDSMVVYTQNVDVQARSGRSSDAQFIFNTGLLPLNGEALVSRYASADYPSLAKALSSHTSYEIIGESKAIWSHALTTKSYGFDTLIDNVSTSIINQDKVILSKALDLCDSISQPFFMFITTLSMHAPYNEIRVDKLSDGKKHCIKSNYSDNRDRNYLSALAHFDSSFKEFIDGLKIAGLYSNTIIVIVGDHEAGNSCLSPALHSYNVPLLILNSGVDYRYSHSIGQVDIFPTLLDVMAVDSYIPQNISYNYRGMGSSIFRVPYVAVDEEAWDVSAKIVRGRYFD